MKVNLAENSNFGLHQLMNLFCEDFFFFKNNNKSRSLYATADLELLPLQLMEQIHTLNAHPLR